MTPIKILDSMILLFQHNNWNKLHFALNKDNKDEFLDSPDAISFCISGALQRICYLNRVPTKIYQEVDTIIRKHIPSYSIVHYNDFEVNSKEEVIEFLEKVRKSTHIE